MAGSEAPQHEQLLPAEDFTNLQRVKVYRLNDSGHWDDKGTGHVSCEYMEVRRDRAPVRRFKMPMRFF
jgi:protein phosphatase-4 regulatory subunit 3